MRHNDIFNSFGRPPIFFYPIHVQIAGRLTSGILFAYLHRQFNYHDKQEIYNTDIEVMRDTGLSPNELRRAKEDLKNLPFLQIFRAGADGRTHYKIDPEELDGFLKGLKSVSGNSRFGKFTKPEPFGFVKSTNPIKREDPKKDITHTLSRPSASRSVPTDRDEELEKWKAFASKLATAIAAVHKVNHTSHITAWAREFRLLHTIEKVERRRIRKALDWYCAEFPLQYRVPFFPHIESGSAFRKKFIKIENAMARQVEDGENGQPEDDEKEFAVSSRQVGVRHVRAGESIVGEYDE